MAGACDVFTIGGESHGLIEDIVELTPAHGGWRSNRLTEVEATPAIATLLRARFGAKLHDRDGRRPSGSIRMLEKTPKNALRIPFLRRIFPDARFLYLHRAPSPNIASMLQAWESQRFRTYPQLPGWRGPSWSMLLTPGWSKLIGSPLNLVAATQWAAVTEILLDDLEALPASRWTAVSYEAFIRDPAATVEDVCAAFDLQADRLPPATLPLARNTLTPPHAEKWRARQTDIEAVDAIFRPQALRAAKLLNFESLSSVSSKIEQKYKEIA